MLKPAATSAVAPDSGEAASYLGDKFPGATLVTRVMLMDGGADLYGVIQ